MARRRISSTTPLPSQRSSPRLRSSEKNDEPLTVTSSNAAEAHQVSPTPHKEVPDQAVSQDLQASDSSDDEEETGDSPTPQYYEFNGTQYSTYSDMVKAKRDRNQAMLVESGLLQVSAAVKAAPSRPSKKRSAPSVPTAPARQSRRLRGERVESSRFVHEEKGGRFEFGREGAGADDTVGDEDDNLSEKAEPKHYANRIHDETPISLAQAVENVGEKWLPSSDSQNEDEEGSSVALQNAERLSEAISKWDSTSVQSPSNNRRRSPSIVKEGGLDPAVQKRVQRLAIDTSGTSHGESNEKLVPDRIYSMAFHPSSDQILVGAGDKQGYVGLWNASSSSKDKVHRFRVHAACVNSLEWTPRGDALLSTSYDGTCRLWNVEQQQFEQVFAAYGKESQYAQQPGAGILSGDYGNNGKDVVWFQSATWDHRRPEHAFFVSTSVGSVLHVDIRSRNRLTWQESLSDRKINSVSLHPNGYSFLSSGLDCCVKLWDLRKFETANQKKSKQGTLKPLATFHGKKSINSAYFSPVAGQHVVATTMDDSLDVLQDFHLTTTPPPIVTTTTASKKKSRSTKVQNDASIQVVQRFPHNNCTGRWLSTFMAPWHPTVDHLFAVGSMDQPRNLHVYSTQQQEVAVPGLSAVASRLCFHPSAHEIILAGGNSSGRVTLIRESKD